MNRTPAAFSYFGGKWRIAPWVVSHFPPHQTFVDLFGGAANIILAKQPADQLDVYNDLDGNLVNFFRVLRNDGDELIRRIDLTPYSREEFERAVNIKNDGGASSPMMKAWAFFVFMKQSNFGGISDTWRWAIRGGSQTSPSYWLNAPATLAEIPHRLKGIQIEHGTYTKQVERYDSPETLFYADPPYLKEVRKEKSKNREYPHDMNTRNEHCELAAVLHGIKGMACISHYPSQLYSELYSDWHHVETETFDFRANKRTDCLWINRAAWDRLEFGIQQDMFKG